LSFVLTRSLTDLVDADVVSRGGMIGKHAGGGASALFVDAAALDLDPTSIRFLPISSMGADDKAIRDAGSIAVAEI